MKNHEMAVSEISWEFMGPAMATSYYHDYPNGSQEKSWVARWSNCGMKTYAMFNTED